MKAATGPLLAIVSALVGATSLPGPPIPGDWIPYLDMSDEFDGSRLNSSKWQDHDEGWRGRQPGLFDPANVKVQDGYLTLLSKNAVLPTSLAKLGYANYTTSAVHSVARTRLLLALTLSHPGSLHSSSSP